MLTVFIQNTYIHKCTNAMCMSVPELPIPYLALVVGFHFWSSAIARASTEPGDWGVTHTTTHTTGTNYVWTTWTRCLVGFWAMWIVCTYVRMWPSRNGTYIRAYIVECTCTIHIETSIHNTSGRAAIVENAILLCTTMKVSSLVDECKQTTLFLLLSRTVAVTKPCKCIRTYVHTMHTMCTHTPLSTHIHASRGWTSLYHLWKWW